MSAGWFFFCPINQTDAEETPHRLFYESQSPLISDSHRGTTCFFFQTPRFGMCRRGCGSQKASRRKASAWPVGADTGACRGTPGKELGCQFRPPHVAAARDAAAPPNSWRKRRHRRGVGGAWAPPRLGGLSERPRPLPAARARAPSSAARFLPRPSATGPLGAAAPHLSEQRLQRARRGGRAGRRSGEMNTVLSRANSLFAFCLSVMAALTFGCFITTAFKERSVPVGITVSRVSM